MEQFTSRDLDVEVRLTVTDIKIEAGRIWLIQLDYDKTHWRTVTNIHGPHEKVISLRDRKYKLLKKNSAPRG
jgi:hypothetical protein